MAQVIQGSGGGYPDRPGSASAESVRQKKRGASMGHRFAALDQRLDDYLHEFNRERNEQGQFVTDEGAASDPGMMQRAYGGALAAGGAAAGAAGNAVMEGVGALATGAAVAGMAGTKAGRKAAMGLVRALKHRASGRIGY